MAKTKMGVKAKITHHPLQESLQTRTILGMPFHVIELGIAVGLYVGMFTFVNWASRLLCFVIGAWFSWGAWVDYHKFEEAKRKCNEKK